jgi:iron complex outermembrane recepter protein
MASSKSRLGHDCQAGPADRRRKAASAISGAGAVMMVAGLSSTVVLAQTAPTSAAADSSALQEVVVTARKRTESLVEVPESISVLSDRTLEDLHIESFLDYANKIPDMAFSYGTGTFNGITESRSIAIRGITGSNTTALYIDDTPINQGMDPRVVDLERIEVLKGPQGTLFGSDSMGGTVRLITKKPDTSQDDFRVMTEAGATSGGGSADYGGELVANFVVVPDVFAVRTMLFQRHEAGFLTRTYPLPSNPAETGSAGDQGADLTSGFSVTGLWHVLKGLDASLRVMYQQDALKGWPDTYAPLPDFEPDSYNRPQPRDLQDRASYNWWMPSLELSYQGTGWSFVSSTSYYDFERKQLEDSEAGSIQFMEDFYGVAPPADRDPWFSARGTRHFTEEMRASFDEVWHISGVVGAYYSDDLTRGGWPGTYYYGLTDLGIGATTNLVYSEYDNDRDHEAALFGELYYHFGPKTILTLGARRYRLTQEATSITNGFFNGGEIISGPAANVEEGTSPKFALSQGIGQDANAYASAAKGFRPGGVGGTLPTTCNPEIEALGLVPTDTTHFNPDSVWTYEAGAKSNLWNRTTLASVAVYQTNWTDVQQPINLPGCGYQFLGNAGTARVRGAEFELRGRPLQPLELGLGLGYEDARVTTAGTSAFTVGERLFQIPEVTATLNATYRVPISDRLQGFVSGDYSYTGNSLSGNTTPATPLTRPAYSLGNARVGIEWARSSLSLYVNNIGNAHANLGDLVFLGFTQSTTSPSGQTIPYPRVVVTPPLQVGLQYRASFGGH